MLMRTLGSSAALVLLLTLSGCGDDSPARGEDPAGSTDRGAGDGATGAQGQGRCQYPSDGSEPAREVSAPPSEPTVKGRVEVDLATSIGDLVLTLDAKRTPCTVNNFVSLARQGWFDDTDCHRLTTSGIFVLQCGDPTGTSSGGPGYTIPDEVDGSETYPAGTIAMAKTPMPNSGGSQFFLVYDETPLPPDYTVFGTIDEQGLESLREAAADGTVDGAPDGTPKTTVTLENAKVA